MRMMSDYAVPRGCEENVHVLTDLDAPFAESVKSRSCLQFSKPGLAAVFISLCGCLGSLSRTKLPDCSLPGRHRDVQDVEQVFLDTLDAIEEFNEFGCLNCIHEGLAHARRRGIRLGRPETVSEHRDAVARLRARRLSGRAIAKEVGRPSSSVFRIIAKLGRKMRRESGRGRPRA